MSAEKQTDTELLAELAGVLGRCLERMTNLEHCYLVGVPS